MEERVPHWVQLREGDEISSGRLLTHLNASDEGIGLGGSRLAENVLECGRELVAVQRHHPVVVVACPTAARQVIIGCINLSWGQSADAVASCAYVTLVSRNSRCSHVLDVKIGSS